MKHLVRPEEPDFLRNNAEQWGKEYAAKRAADPAHTLQWRQIDNKKVNVLLRKILSEEMTQHHCSYCDGGYILGASAQATIDHFRPKSLFPYHVYQWENLFVCCNICQEKKLEQFEEALLKPDAEDFSPARYFVFNFKTGKIDVNRHAEMNDQVRAETTIRILGLNDTPRPSARKSELQKWDNSAQTSPNLDEFNYRFFLAP
jgi:uncharacterized protein (TIGR02646 family)